MPRVKQKSTTTHTKRTPALSLEARENQMIALAVDEAERQLREGCASSQVITHYLKLGTTKERLEKEKMEHEIELLQAKVKSLESAERIEELYINALNAMKSYSGQDDTNE